MQRPALLASAVVAVTAAAGIAWVATAAPAVAAVVNLQDVVPAPVSAQPTAGVTYTLPSNATIQTQSGSAAATDAGNYLAGILRPSTGYALPVAAASGTPTSGIALLLSGADASVGAEGYQLDVTAGLVTVRAQTAAGLFHGVQTLRQLLPPSIEAKTVQPGPWTLAGGRIVDYPRYAYRGAMLDVSRHFFGVDTVKRYIDEIAQYKLNTLHLHLSDDQGWRIVIDAWPRLATYGGSTQVGGGAGGYYTKAQYSDIVSYAAARHVTIVPEIDMPGHTTAALASYAELNCNNTAPPLYTGTDVGFSSLCIGKEVTYTFVQQVLAELAAITPGPYLHIGGDEAHSTSAADYRTFMNRIQPFVGANGKTVLGWHQLGQADHTANRVAQYWGTGSSDADLAAAVSKGDKVLLSPANKTYLDMKYTWETPLGLTWAGLIEVQTAYGWDPATLLTGVPAASIIGVEAPMWAETLTKLTDIEFMAFPRMPALAELAWSPQAVRNWDTFKVRLGAQGPRWTIQGINFYRSPQVPWGTVSSPSPSASVSPSASTSQPPGSGLVNGGFESGSLAPWSGTGCSVVSSPVRSGTKALAGAVTASDNARCQQTVTVLPNRTYRLSGYVRGSYVYLGATGTGVSASTWTPGTGGTYAPLSLTFTTGASTTSVTVYVHGWYGQPPYNADDITLTLA
ncbi:family 20 glycosylhydrolase [Dactylosporangium sp. AC04546]|uniref:family 20 glycosylhydrolase n=1 Tax=Dactylosporangium sp. AC04546 TaxID=2862460 RepID=UPI001EDDA1A7|nr:family 20 glycosylhydrolase [Dactylosporangium sp. AC04546]WVK81821.1 family 20 glycosylhydrolase [Dactylosporangium sp. AC04546]